MIRRVLNTLILLPFLHLAFFSQTLAADKFTTQNTKPVETDWPGPRASDLMTALNQLRQDVRILDSAVGSPFLSLPSVTISHPPSINEIDQYFSNLVDHLAQLRGSGLMTLSLAEQLIDEYKAEFASVEQSNASTNSKDVTFRIRIRIQKIEQLAHHMSNYLNKIRDAEIKIRETQEIVTILVPMGFDQRTSTEIKKMMTEIDNLKREGYIATSGVDTIYKQSND